MSCFQLITESLIERSESCHKHSQIKQKCRFNSVCSGAHVSRPSIVSLNKEKVTWRGGPRGGRWLWTTARLSQLPPLFWRSSHQTSIEIRWKLQTIEPLIIDLHFSVSKLGCNALVQEIDESTAKKVLIESVQASEQAKVRINYSESRARVATCVHAFRVVAFFPRKSSSDRLNAN